jgi:hypothetical protein
LPEAVRGDQVQRGLHAVAHRERLPLQLEVAALDLGEVQDVVDDHQQGVTAHPDGLGVVALLRVQRRVEQQPGHADHGVHRGADLVRHGGQEVRLGCRGGLGLGMRGDELGLAVLHRPPLGDQRVGQLVQTRPMALQLSRPGPRGERADRSPSLRRPMVEVSSSTGSTTPARSRRNCRSTTKATTAASSTSSSSPTDSRDRWRCSEESRSSSASASARCSSTR